MLIIFRKVSANNTEIRKIRTWRLNITDLFTKQAKDKLDVNRLKGYLIGDKLYRRHIGFGARNGMFVNHRKMSEYAFLVSLIIICEDISETQSLELELAVEFAKKIVRDSQAGIQCDFCDKWIHTDCIGLSEEE